MKAIGISRYNAEIVTFRDWLKPSPAAGEILVQVFAAGVNPLDWKVHDGSVAQFLPVSPPFILGADVSGIVEAIGAGVTRFSVGDAVFGQVGLLGAYAEYAVANQYRFARKPETLSHAEAAAIPVSGETADEALFAQGGLKAEERVLIHGASGGVGSFAVQLAHNAGAYVIATTSAGNADFVRGLGAKEIIDYRAARFEEKAADIDLVLDTRGGEVIDRSWSVLKPNGRLVTSVPPEGKSLVHGDRTAIFAIGKPDPDGANLDRLAALAAEGRLKPQIQQTFPLEQAETALKICKEGHVRGKLALIVSGAGS